jgi:hypothetical protein
VKWRRNFVQNAMRNLMIMFYFANIAVFQQLDLKMKFLRLLPFQWDFWSKQEYPAYYIVGDLPNIVREGVFVETK